MFKNVLWKKIKKLWTSRQKEKRGKTDNMLDLPAEVVEVDAFKRKLGFASEDNRSSGRSRRSHGDEIVSERGDISLLPSRSPPSPCTRETYDMSDLPADLVEAEILSRIPATSLKRLSCVCKRWNALFKEPGFSEMHFRNAPRQSRVLMLMWFRLFPMSVDLNVAPPSIEFKYALSLRASYFSFEPVCIAEVFHCDGLLLCVPIDNRPLVWNPYLGETKWIQHKDGYNTSCKFAIGYDNDQSCRSYKTLMYWDHTCQTNNPDGGFEIFEFSSNSWRVVTPPNPVRIGLKYRGVTLKGNTYWIAFDENGYNYLLSFDFTRERFRRFSLPPSSKHYMALSVVSEEKLSMVSVGYKFEIWVTKKIDTSAELSWSKSFAVDFYRTSPDLDSSAFTSLFLDEEKRVALCCDEVSRNTRNVVYCIEEEDKYKIIVPNLKDRIRAWYELQKPFLFNYVPSLVHIQPKIVVSSPQAVPRASEINFVGF